MTPRPSMVAAFRVAFEGLYRLVRHERNFAIHCVLGSLTIALAVALRIDRTEWLFVIFAITLVLTAEALNSAIERVVDLASPEWHALAKQSKDTAAAAVLIASIGAAAVGLVIFVPKLIALAR